MKCRCGLLILESEIQISPEKYGKKSAKKKQEEEEKRETLKITSSSSLYSG